MNNVPQARRPFDAQRQSQLPFYPGHFKLRVVVVGFILLYW